MPDKTPLANLARYYLACMDQDEGISASATSPPDDLDYAELDGLSSLHDDNLFDQPGPRRLLEKIRKDRFRLAMYAGYPCTLKPVQPKGANPFRYFVEPIFIYPIDMDSAHGMQPKVDLTLPIINPSVLKRFTNAEREELMDELARLKVDLGLTDELEPPELGALARRLNMVRPEWTWREPCDPANVIASPPLAKVKGEGIYNRLALIVGERSPFTQGLESELKALIRLSESQYGDTALGHWVNGNIPASACNSGSALLDALPLNTEQQQAVQQALSHNLTVITGPPGTGKSQVVANLLLNAAWQGKRVLFASKNNKAVDVVEERLNNLGSRPILLRVGSNQYRAKLAEYLLAMLSATSTEENELTYKENLDKHITLAGERKRLDGDLMNIIKLRNRVDALESDAEGARKKLPAETITYLRDSGLGEIQSIAAGFRSLLDNATRRKQPLFMRLLWHFFKKKRFDELAKAATGLEDAVQLLGISMPPDMPTDDSLNSWHRFGNLLTIQLNLAERFCEYMGSLRQLQAAKTMQDIARKQAAVTRQLVDNDKALWENWLRLQPSNLSRSTRALLNQYRTLLEMVIENGTDRRLPPELYRGYVKLSKKMTHLLPCWAVTSLSARNLPFEAGLFDLVVFDEASQCDIASALPLLYRAKRAVVIGDPKQLSHISGLKRGQDQQLLEKYGLSKGYVNWAYSYNSLFGLAKGNGAKGDFIHLRDHHRSHTNIIEFSNRSFYEGDLRVVTPYKYLKFPRHNNTGVGWMHIKGKVNRPDNGGAVNPSEASTVVQMLRRLVIEQGYPGTVGVVSPFRAQANLIRRLIGRDSELEQCLIHADFLVDTVHKFQGDERDVMIFSPVLSDGISQSATDFIRNNGNLFNVAITRARAMLLVVGDKYAPSQYEVEYLRKFATYVRELKEAEQNGSKPSPLDLGQEYPPVSNPERVSEWEKILYKALYSAGINTLPQYQEEKYTLDLALFDGERKLNIEVDGEHYHRNWNGELCRRDQIRNQQLFELGWDVMRFWVYEVRDDLDQCVSKVQQWIKNDA